MNDLPQRQITPRTGLVLILIAIVVPLVLSFLMADRGYLVMPTLVVPLILMAVWSDLGFVLGFFFFWGTLVGLTWSSVDAESVDNFTPALAISMSWLPYVLFYGPVFLLMKSTDRVKASWSRTSSEESQDV